MATSQGWLQSATQSVAEGADTLAAALLGAAFAVVGVVLSNRANLKALRAQQDHERSLRKLEYELAAKREVYMQAAEAVSAAMTAIGSFSHLEKEHDELVSAFHGKSEALAKVHIVASIETASHFMKFMQEFGNSLVELNIKKERLAVVRREMISKIEIMKRHDASRDQYLEIMRQMNLNGEADKRKWEYLQEAFEFESRSSSEAAAAHDKILASLGPKHIDLVKACFVEQRKLQLLLVPLVAAVREELHLPVDAEAYARLLKTPVEFTDDQLERLFNAGDATP